MYGKIHTDLNWPILAKQKIAHSSGFPLQHLPCGLPSCGRVIGSPCPWLSPAGSG